MRNKKYGATFVTVVVVGALSSVGVVSWWFYQNTRHVVSAPTIGDQSSEAVAGVQQVAEEMKASPFDAVALQRVIDEWDASIGADKDTSVVIADDSGAVLAELNPDESYLTASLYKMYVAYEGYKALDSGDLNGAETLQLDRTISECLDLMIRESDSFCGEQLWTTLGKEKIDKNLEAYGIVDTDIVGLQTTAADTAMMLARIARGEGITEMSQSKYLDSMKTQPLLYRRGLPSGFSDTVTVYNKVGWSEFAEWHDAAIVERADGELLIVAVLTKNVGTKKIAELARKLEPVIL